jgi:nitrite reductase (cytochrome c-552)
MATGWTDWRRESKVRLAAFVATAAGVALVSAGITALLVNIFERKQEAKDPYLKLVQVTEDTTDPEIWGTNWPRQFDAYKRTADSTRTRFGGSEALPAQKLERDPWLKRMYAGYAFSIDYRDRRGHAYMLYDQEHTERVTKKSQPGACLHCHASIIPLYRHVGEGDVMKGFEEVCAMPYQQAHDLKDDAGRPLVRHPVSCVDCHDPKNMELRVTRPGFLNGIKALKASQGIAGYDPNRDATRQEMRSYVCGQCHVEYYFKGERKTLTYPWNRGLKVEDIEAYYDEAGYSDWTHAETGAPALKAQHPEFEMWNQGIHSRSGVACADCHMPYVREGALKLSDHWVRSPLVSDESISRSCQPCHRYPEAEIRARVDVIQTRNNDLIQRASKALTDQMDAAQAASRAGATAAEMAPILDLQRKAQWRIDFVSSENSMGFHAPQEAARILGEAIDYARQGQAKAAQLAAAKY